MDWHQKRLFIKAGKGKKDRYVYLPDKLKKLLDEYQGGYPTQYWYFEGQEGGQYSVRSIQAVFHQSLERSGVAMPSFFPTAIVMRLIRQCLLQCRRCARADGEES